MQKTSSSPSHTYKPLPKKGRSQLFHLCFPVRRRGVHHRASVFLPPLTLHWPFSQAVSPGSTGSPLHVHMRILLPRTQMISYILYPVLHLSTKRPSPALWSVLLQVLLPSFYKEVNCLQELFIFFSCFHLTVFILCSTYNYWMTLGTGFEVVLRTDLVLPSCG